MAAWQELLGEHLIENRTDQVAEAFRQVSIDELNNKVVGLYFSYVVFHFFSISISFSIISEHIGVHPVEHLHQFSLMPIKKLMLQ